MSQRILETLEFFEHELLGSSPHDFPRIVQKLAERELPHAKSLKVLETNPTLNGFSVMVSYIPPACEPKPLPAGYTKWSLRQSQRATLRERALPAVRKGMQPIVVIEDYKPEVRY